MSSANIEVLSEKLREKQRELLADIARLKEEAEGSTEAEDVGDSAEKDEDEAVATGEFALESATLEQVQDALKRMSNGTYGNCLVCGKPIPDARLNAIPWTPFCMDHAPK